MAEGPRYALVVWRDRWELANLELEQAELEAERGRVIIIGREDEACMPYLEGKPVQRNANRAGDTGEE